MTRDRRQALRTLAGVSAAAAAGATTAGAAPALRAQGDFPSRPVRLVVPYPPGGFTDIVARLLGENLAEPLGQQIVVENRPGAGTNIGAELVARAAPDGYTLFVGTTSLAINATLYRKLSYDAARDFVPVGLFVSSGFVLLAGERVKANTVQDLIAMAKERPDGLTFGSSGNGAVNHMAGGLLNSLAGIKLRHVPYKGSAPALVDLIGGQIDLVWATVLESLPHLRAGRVRALGTTNDARIPAAPDIAPIADALPGYVATFWMGLFAPAGTPAPVVDRLARAVQRAVQQPAYRERLERDGAEARYLDAAALGQFLKAENDKWARVVRDADVRVD